MESHDLENGARSSVLELKLGLVVIHILCEFGDCTSKAKEVRDIIRTIKITLTHCARENPLS